MGRLIFLSPIAGLIAALLGGGVVLLLYMLKLRRRPLQVSSTMLWRRAVRDMEGNIPWQRISPSLLLLLHLLIVLLLSLAIARPVIDDAIGSNDRVYLIVDTTASMSAEVEQVSGIRRAKDLAIERVRALFDSGRSARVSVIEAGLEPRVILAESNERGRLIAAVESVRGTDQPGTIGPAIELIETLHEATRAEDGGEDGGPVEIESQAVVWAYTDGGTVEDDAIPMRGGGGVTVAVWHEDADVGNMGIVAVGAQRDRVDPALCRVFVRVERSSDGPTASVVRIFEGENLITSSAVSFDEGERTLTHTFELRLMVGVLLRLELTGDDALDSDNRAWVDIPDPSPVRVTVVAPDAEADPILVDVLEVITRTSVAVVAEDEPTGDADLVVYDRVSPDAVFAGPSIGFASVMPGGGRRLDELGPRRRMISWDRAHPVLQSAGVGAVSYRRSVMFGDGEGVRTLASDAQGAVIAEFARGADRHLRVAFALHDSNWPVQYGLAVFLINAIEQLLPGASGVGAVTSTREVIELPVEGGEPIAVGPFPQVGVKAIEQAGGKRIGVSLLSPSETAMAIRAPVPIGSGRVDASGGDAGDAQRELWRWFTLAAIVLAAIEWFVYARKVRIA